MATQLTIDITTTADQNVVAAIGNSNHLINGGFESFDAIAPFNPTPWVIIPTPTFPAGPTQPTFGPETTIVCEGIQSLSWSHDGAGTRPSIHQIINVEDFMKGSVMRITGKIRSSTSATQTLSMSIGINGVATPTLVLPNGSENENIVNPQTGVIFNFEYDDQQWYEFDYYYHVPESGVISAGPVLYPTAEDSTTEVYLDDVKVFFELTNRSEAWRIDLEPVDNFIYGYGYGDKDGFVPEGTPLEDTSLDFFNVIGVLGTNEGFGIEDSVPDAEFPDLDNHCYAFGYEYASAFLADKMDSIVVKATVFENNIRQPDVRVVFKASPGVCLEPNSTTTNKFGEAFVEVSIDIDTLQDTTRSPNAAKFSQIPFNGFLTVFAEIDRDPRENEGFSIIKTQAIQITETALDILDIGTYAFQKRSGFTYGYAGYGYFPFDDPLTLIC